MPGVTRKTVDTAGGQLVQGSGDVFVNGQPMVRLGDLVANHGIGPHTGSTFEEDDGFGPRPPPRQGVKMVEGSSSVFCNGIPACRAGHKASCGHAATGSTDVFIGG